MYVCGVKDGEKQRSRDSEAFASAFKANLEEVFPQYCMHDDLCSRLQPSTTTIWYVVLSR